MRPRQLALCVEDHRDTSEMLRRMLSRLGFEVMIADTLLGAMLVALPGAFRLYVLDTWVGERSGVELLKYIRATDPHTPVVFFSAVADEPARREALAAGATAYVVKPDLGRLLEVITDVTPADDGSTSPPLFSRAAPPADSPADEVK